MSEPVITIPIIIWLLEAVLYTARQQSTSIQFQKIGGLDQMPVIWSTIPYPTKYIF